MSAAEFVAGFWHAVLARAETPNLRLVDVPSDYRTRINGALSTFYTNNAGDVEGGKGIPGLNRPIAWQAGHEFGIVFSRQRAAAKAADLGVELANRMTLAARAQKRVRLRMVDGVTTATEIDG